MADCPFTLPPAAQEIYKEVFESSKARADSDMQAARNAWKVVKMRYKKRNGTWVLRKAPKTPVAARGRFLRVRG